MAVKVDDRKPGARDEMLRDNECRRGLVFADVRKRRVRRTIASALPALRDADNHHGAEKRGGDEGCPPNHEGIVPKVSQLAGKPNSVSCRSATANDHSSTPAIARRLQRPTR